MRKKVIEWISRESESTMSRLILSSVFFLLRDSEDGGFDVLLLSISHSLYCFDPQSKQRKLKQKLVFTKKIWCVYKAPTFFLHTHAQKSSFNQNRSDILAQN